MTITINYFEHQIELSIESVFSCEIENKNYFYRFVKDLFTANNGTPTEEIKVYIDNNEVTLSNRFFIIIDFFNFGFDSKKIQTAINKYIISSLEESDKEDYNKIFKQLLKKTKRMTSNMDIDLELTEEYSLENLMRILKIVPKQSNYLLNNLFTIIDLVKCLHINEAVVFVNLKQYLSKNELEELYKYATYNQIIILLVDSISTGITMNREKKLIIDCDLNEYMII